jgi:glycine/D-amino acid oxidase-like deaminating enzyme
VKVRHVAVLGAGIMGSATALLLARGGARVVLFDRAPRPFAGASRWNEGKIHLGHLYAADPSLQTARCVLPGGLAFKPLTERLIGCSLEGAITAEDDTYLVHRNSAVAIGAMAHYFEAVTALAAAHPGRAGYLADLSGARCHRLTAAELDCLADTSRIAAGFRVPERSVSTTWLADRFVEALAAEPRIEQAMATEVRAVHGDAALAGRLTVETSRGIEGPFDAVVNALWEGRIALDEQLGIRTPAGFSHRYRLSLFLRTREPATLPSAVIALGPFGDVKNYGGREFYLSWYPAGLMAEGGDFAPPVLEPLTPTARQRIAADILDQLGGLLPGVAELPAKAVEMRVEGGWVYAAGRGSLADPAATIHRRDRLGIQRHGAYLSIDTGKYSVAPWLAEQVVEMLGF